MMLDVEKKLESGIGAFLDHMAFECKYVVPFMGHTEKRSSIVQHEPTEPSSGLDVLVSTFRTGSFNAQETLTFKNAHELGA